MCSMPRSVDPHPPTPRRGGALLCRPGAASSPRAQPLLRARGVARRFWSSATTTRRRLAPREGESRCTSRPPPNPRHREGPTRPRSLWNEVVGARSVLAGQRCLPSRDSSIARTQLPRRPRVIRCQSHQLGQTDPLHAPGRAAPQASHAQPLSWSTVCTAPSRRGTAPTPVRLDGREPRLDSQLAGMAGLHGSVPTAREIFARVSDVACTRCVPSGGDDR